MRSINEFLVKKHQNILTPHLVIMGGKENDFNFITIAESRIYNKIEDIDAFNKKIEKDLDAKFSGTFAKILNSYIDKEKYEIKERGTGGKLSKSTTKLIFNKDDNGVIYNLLTSKYDIDRQLKYHRIRYDDNYVELYLLMK